MKKILHIVEPLATGILSFLLDLTKCQVNEYEVYILYGVRPQTPNNVENLFDERVKLIRLDKFKGVARSIFNFSTYITVAEICRKINPHYVHLHSSVAGCIGRIVLPCNDIKVFYTPHGFSFLMNDAGFLNKISYWSIEYLLSKTKSRIIACSSGEYSHAVKLSSKSCFVNNGVDVFELNKFVQEGCNINLKQVCISGRISYQKNPDLFNDIALLLPDVQFVWIGDGELKTKLTARNITVTGWISKEKALNLVAQSNFFILPSFWEGLSISLLEAMFMGKVCIVSDIDGNRSVIINGVNGFICSSASDFAAKIRSIIDLNDNSIINSLKSQASHDVVESYSLTLMAEKYSHIYNLEY